ncbi:MAG: hypothetical protein KKF88_07485 [Alphaproteobacteria bacterium]|nr:hypothetical protein [Alphaproteobacteria bacterium]
MNKIFAAASAVIGLGALALVPTAVQAQDPTGAAVVDYIFGVEYYFEQLEAELGVASSGSQVGRQSAGNVQTVTFDLRAGGTYVLLGACDGGCSDLDMIVRDPSGNEVGRDEEMNARPFVIIQGARGGRYTVDVGMVTCQGSCNWGVRAYSAD